MRDVLTVETNTLDILTDYFTGRYTAYLDYIQSSDEPVCSYTENPDCFISRA